MAETQSAARPRKDRFPLLLTIVSLALAVLVVLLARENQRLEKELVEARQPGLADALKEGDRLEAFSVYDPAGSELPVGFGQARRRLLLAFTSTCPHCQKNFPVWTDLLRGGASGLEIVGVQLDAGPGGAARVPSLPFTVYVPGKKAPAFASKLYGVPATMIVDGSGRIEKVWYGALGPDEVAAVRHAMGA